jgi:hypothetical protein
MMLWIAYGFGALAIATIGVLRVAQATRSWPTVEGRVISGEELKAVGVPPYPFAYEYMVRGARHVSGTVALFASQGQEREVALQHHVGSIVVVYYNPTAPERGLLIPGASARLWALLGGIVTVAVIAGAAVVWQWFK